AGFGACGVLVCGLRRRAARWRRGAQIRQRACCSRVARHGPLRASAGSLAAHVAAHTLDVHRGHAHVCVRSSGHGARATAAPGVRRRGLELDDGGGVGSGQHGRAAGRRDRGPAGHTGGHHRDDAADGGGDRRRGRVYGFHAQRRQVAVRFGVGMYSAQRPPGSPFTHRELSDDMLRQARLAEDVSLDSFWIAEHHFAGDGDAAAVIPVCAAVLGATHRLIAGTSVAIASFYNPLRLAEDAIALDLLSGGRFVLGLGTAYRPEEFAGMGIDASTDEARLEEITEILDRAFTGRPFSHRGRYYQIPELAVTPAPLTEGGPPIMLAGDGSADAAAARAGQRGKRYMVDPSLRLDEVMRLVGIYDAAFRGERGLELPLFSYGFVSDETDPWEEMR